MSSTLTLIILIIIALCYKPLKKQYIAWKCIRNGALEGNWIYYGVAFCLQNDIMPYVCDVNGDEIDNYEDIDYLVFWYIGNQIRIYHDDLMRYHIAITSSVVKDANDDSDHDTVESLRKEHPDFEFLWSSLDKGKKELVVSWLIPDNGFDKKSRHMIVPYITKTLVPVRDEVREKFNSQNNMSQNKT